MSTPKTLGSVVTADNGAVRVITLNRPDKLNAIDMPVRLELAAACDRVVAAENACFAATFTVVGLAGDMGAFTSLPARVGIARARQMLLMPTPMTGTEALQIGLVDAVVAPGEALRSALADATRLAEGPARALGVIKAMLAASLRLTPFEVLDREAAYQAELFDSDDFGEGIIAFRERRTPKFGGVRTREEPDQ